jgi:hypothetical protein
MVHDQRQAIGAGKSRQAADARRDKKTVTHFLAVPGNDLIEEP